MKNLIIYKVALILLATMGICQANAQEEIEAQELVAWDFYGLGVAQIDHKQIYMAEKENSSGVMLVSPKTYLGDVVMRYQLMPLTASTVCVAILNAHDQEDFSYSVPKKYNGYVQHWNEDMNAYFFAFHNASHNWTPFLQKGEIEKGKARKLDIAEQNHMQVGRYYEIEVGKKGNRIWLKIDGQQVLEAIDEHSYQGGHLALRIRGTAYNLASCLIRKLQITTD